MSDHPSGRHHHDEHPQTFDEVIKRGFPAEDLVKQASDYSRDAGPAAPTRAQRPEARDLEDVETPHTVRKDAQSYLPEEQSAYRNAVERLVANGSYGELIAQHLDMSHRMHGSMGVVGLYRFLGW